MPRAPLPRRPSPSLLPALLLLAGAPASADVRPAVTCPVGAHKKVLEKGGLVAEYCLDEAGRLHGDAITHLPSGQRINDDHWDHGTKVGVWIEWYPSGLKKSETRYLAGKREGEYAEWSEKGQPLTRGAFKGDREMGPWLFAREGDPSELSFAVFDRGVELSGKLLDHGPGDCRALSALSVEARRGFVASVALLSLLRLPETTKSRVKDWWKVGLCLRDGSGGASGELDAACARGAKLDQEGPAAASRLAGRCTGPLPRGRK